METQLRCCRTRDGPHTIAGKVTPSRRRRCYVERPTRANRALGNDIERAESVERVTVKPVFRRKGSDLCRSDAEEEPSSGRKFRVLFVSESGICRSILAHTLFTRKVRALGLEEHVCSSARACRDYALGERPSDTVQSVAREKNWNVGEDYRATLMDLQADAAGSDLILCVDKFVAEDVMKEVTLYELTETDADLSSRIKLLGEWMLGSESKEIEDPLYGNYGGETEHRAVAECAEKIDVCCSQLCHAISSALDSLAVASTAEEIRGEVLSGVGNSSLDWLLPPMLQGKKDK